jgi:hypothetical protein
MALNEPPLTAIAWQVWPAAPVAMSSERAPPPTVHAAVSKMVTVPVHAPLVHEQPVSLHVAVFVRLVPARRRVG